MSGHPSADSEERTRLARILLDSGRWVEVSQLARARLLRALDGQRFTPQKEQDITRLCPRTTTHQVVTRLRAR